MDYGIITRFFKYFGESLREVSIIILIAGIIRLIVTLAFGPLAGRIVTWLYILGRLLVTATGPATKDDDLKRRRRRSNERTGSL
jgi:hypothetical protein